METNFTFRNLDPTEGIKDHALKKMEKARKYMFNPIAAHFIFSLDKFRQSCEITINDKGQEYVVSETTTDMYQAIDRAVEKIIRQLKKKKDKVKAHKA